MKHHNARYDVLIAGAGFAGSLAALLLHQLGRKVCLVEKAKHPRFAIGESSTPAADMILRRFASSYQLPWLEAFSRYGSWCRTYPEVMRGLKRGFSFYKHHPGKPFYTNAEHDHELLVAASADDEHSDTQWLRADFDAFLVSKVQEAGIAYLDLTEIVEVEEDGNGLLFTVQQNGRTGRLSADFFLDATGGPHLLHRLWQISSTVEGFHTDSFAVFSHVEQVPLWEDVVVQMGYCTEDYPYRADFSALHHLLDEGWMWMLRFDDGRVSVGFVLDGHRQAMADAAAGQVWQQTLSRYPSLQKLLGGSRLSAQPGKWLRTARLQRRLVQMAGSRWVALPHTAGFVDPLFSPGNAHTLSGLERLISIFQEHTGQHEKLQHSLQHYARELRAELELIDRLVAGCYQTMPHFGLFQAWSMVYFACTIAYEKHRMSSSQPEGFLLATRPEIRRMVTTCVRALEDVLQKGDYSPRQVQCFTDKIRECIAPFNTAGLLDPSAHNMYRHTTAKV
ncbi:MAG: tryptophan 7-halogenase [Thermoflavifilum sp.]|nr:tryptophan 7-halogenase [Thermoflavifilum sp.]